MNDFYMNNRHSRRPPDAAALSATSSWPALAASVALVVLVTLVTSSATSQLPQASSSLSVMQPQLQQSSSSLSVIQQLPDPQLQLQLQQQQQQQKSKYKTKVACEDKLLSIDCEPGFAINLIRANYGRFSLMTCNEQGQLDLSTDCTSAISFRVMQERCQSKPHCLVNATSATFGDKCPKTRKYLEVHYHCVEDSSRVLPSIGQQSNYKPTEDPYGYVNLSSPPTRKSPDFSFPNEQTLAHAAMVPQLTQTFQPPSWPNDMQPVQAPPNPYSGIQFNPNYDSAFGQQHSPNIVHPLRQQPPVDAPSYDPLSQQSEQQDVAGLANNAQSQQQQQRRSSSQSAMLAGFVYFVVTMVVVLAVVLLVALRRRSNALKNVFLSDSASHRTDDTLHNKDLLVINNQNGHQFLYTPASSTKINTHMLAGNHVGGHQTFAPSHLQPHHQQQHHQPHHQFGRDFVLGPNTMRNALTMGNSQQHQQAQHQQHHQTLHHSPPLDQSMFTTHNQIYSSLARGASSQSSHSAGQSNYYCYVKI